MLRIHEFEHAAPPAHGAASELIRSGIIPALEALVQALEDDDLLAGPPSHP